MKRICTIVATLFLLVLIISVKAYAKDADGDINLQECKQVVDEVNNRYGSCFEITAENEKKVVDYVRNHHLTRKEFKDNLLRDYKEIVNTRNLKKEYYDGDDSFLVDPDNGLARKPINEYQQDGRIYRIYRPGDNEDKVRTFDTRELIRQEKNIGFNTTVFLDSVVFSKSGKPGSYKYDAIKYYGLSYPNDADIHFREREISYSLFEQNKKCRITLVGSEETKEGVSYMINRTINVTFSAG